MYKSTKVYGHDLGLSAVFRQWRAKSHCSKLHGYALSFKLTFGCDELDANGWVMDFGALKPIKDELVRLFDHTTLVALDDPEMGRFFRMNDADLITLVVVHRTGCEAFAKLVYDNVTTWLGDYQNGRVRLLSVECAEHGANSAIYEGEQ